MQVSWQLASAMPQAGRHKHTVASSRNVLKLAVIAADAWADKEN